MNKRIYSLAKYLSKNSYLKELDLLFKIAKFESEEEIKENFPVLYDKFFDSTKNLNFIGQIFLQTKKYIENERIKNRDLNEISSFDQLLAKLKEIKKQIKEEESMFKGKEDLTDEMKNYIRENGISKDELNFVYEIETRGNHELTDALTEIVNLKSALNKVKALLQEEELEDLKPVHEYENLDEAVFIINNLRSKSQSKSETAKKLNKYYKYIYDGIELEGEDYSNYGSAEKGGAKNNSKIIYDDGEWLVVQSFSMEAAQYWEKAAVQPKKSGPDFKTCTSRIGEGIEGWTSKNLWGSYEKYNIFQIIKKIDGTYNYFFPEGSDGNHMFTIGFSKDLYEMVEAGSVSVNAKDKPIYKSDILKIDPGKKILDAIADRSGLIDNSEILFSHEIDYLEALSSPQKSALEDASFNLSRFKERFNSSEIEEMKDFSDPAVQIALYKNIISEIYHENIKPETYNKIFNTFPEAKEYFKKLFKKFIADFLRDPKENSSTTFPSADDFSSNLFFLEPPFDTIFDIVGLDLKKFIEEEGDRFLTPENLLFFENNTNILDMFRPINKENLEDIEDEQIRVLETKIREKLKSLTLDQIINHEDFYSIIHEDTYLAEYEDYDSDFGFSYEGILSWDKKNIIDKILNATTEEYNDVLFGSLESTSASMEDFGRLMEALCFKRSIVYQELISKGLNLVDFLRSKNIVFDFKPEDIERNYHSRNSRIITRLDSILHRFRYYNSAQNQNFSPELSRAEIFVNFHVKPKEELLNNIYKKIMNELEFMRIEDRVRIQTKANMSITRLNSNLKNGTLSEDSFSKENIFNTLFGEPNYYDLEVEDITSDLIYKINAVENNIYEKIIPLLPDEQKNKIDELTKEIYLIRNDKDLIREMMVNEVYKIITEHYNQSPETYFELFNAIQN